MCVSENMRNTYDGIADAVHRARTQTFEEWLCGTRKDYDELMGRRIAAFGEERATAFLSRLREKYYLNRRGFVGSSANINTLRALQRRDLIELSHDVDKAIALGGTVVFIGNA